MSVSSNTVDTGGGVVGGVGATWSTQARRWTCAPLARPILDNPIGKTPVMVLQEHCHKYVGKAPDYVDTVEVPGSLPVYRDGDAILGSARPRSTRPRRRRSSAALELLRLVFRR